MSDFDFFNTMIQRIKDMQEERAKKEIHPNIIVMGEDHFHSLERQTTKCGHDAQWGSLSVGTLHALAAANYFGAASTGLKLVKTLREK